MESTLELPRTAGWAFLLGDPDAAGGGWWRWRVLLQTCVFARAATDLYLWRSRLPPPPQNLTKPEPESGRTGHIPHVQGGAAITPRLPPLRPAPHLHSPPPPGGGSRGLRRARDRAPSAGQRTKASMSPKTPPHPTTPHPHGEGRQGERTRGRSLSASCRRPSTHTGWGARSGRRNDSHMEVAHRMHRPPSPAARAEVRVVPRGLR